MGSVGLDVRIERVCVRKAHAGRRRDAGHHRVASVQAVSTTVGEIVGYGKSVSLEYSSCPVEYSLTSGDDQDWSREWVHHRDTSQGQTLTHSNRLLALLRNRQDIRVEVAVEQKQIVGGASIGVNQITWWIVQGLQSGHVHGRKQVG